jgi:hypothetical protein
LKCKHATLSHTLRELILQISKSRVLKTIFRPKLEEVMEDVKKAALLGAS